MRNDLSKGVQAVHVGEVDVLEHHVGSFARSRFHSLSGCVGGEQDEGIGEDYPQRLVRRGVHHK